MTFQVRAAGLTVISPRVPLKDGNKLASPSQLAGALYDRRLGAHPVVCKVLISLRQNGRSAFVVSQAAAVQTRQLLVGPLVVFRGMKHLPAWAQTVGAVGRLLVLFIHNGEWYFKFKKIVFCISLFL